MTNLYTFFWKNSFNNLINIKDSDSEYESKRCQREKKFLVDQKKRIRNKYKKKSVEKIKAYYILIKHSISVQTFMKFDNNSIL